MCVCIYIYFAVITSTRNSLFIFLSFYLFFDLRPIKKCYVEKRKIRFQTAIQTGVLGSGLRGRRLQIVRADKLQSGEYSASANAKTTPAIGTTTPDVRCSGRRGIAVTKLLLLRFLLPAENIIFSPGGHGRSMKLH